LLFYVKRKTIRSVPNPVSAWSGPWGQSITMADLPNTDDGTYFELDPIAFTMSRVNDFTDNTVDRNAGELYNFICLVVESVNVFERAPFLRSTADDMWLKLRTIKITTVLDCVRYNRHLNTRFNVMGSGYRINDNHLDMMLFIGAEWNLRANYSQELHEPNKFTEEHPLKRKVEDLKEEYLASRHM
jgi:hypothetical protein